MSVNWETLKNKGNDEFQKKNYQAAASIYTDALRNDFIITIFIELNPNEDILLTNRALCYIALNKQRNALNDLNTAIKLNPRNIKAFSRLSLIKKITGSLKVSILLLYNTLISMKSI